MEKFLRFKMINIWIGLKMLYCFAQKCLRDKDAFLIVTVIHASNYIKIHTYIFAFGE